VWGILTILVGINNARKHGEPKGTYNGAYAVIDALCGVLFILISMEVL